MSRNVAVPFLAALLLSPALARHRTGAVISATWQELPSLLEGQQIDAVLLNGVRLRGRVRKVEDAGIRIEVRKSSDRLRYPKGIHSVPRSLWASVKVVEYRGPARGILMLLGGVGGASLGVLLVSAELFGEGGSSDPKTPPFMAALTIGFASLGYYGGKRADDRSFLVHIRRIPATSGPAVAVR